MSKLLITATKVRTPEGKTHPDYNKEVFIESDKITILPREGTSKACIHANGFQYDVDAEVAELATALGAEDVSAYT